MATKRYRKSNKSKELTYEDIKGLDLNSLTTEELEQYGLGSWLKKNAGVIGTVVGAGVGSIIPGAGTALGATIGGTIGGGITASNAQKEAVNAQNQQIKTIEQQQMINNKMQEINSADNPLYSGVMRNGGRLRKMKTGGDTKYFLTTSAGKKEISTEKLDSVKKYLDIQNKINSYYTNKYKANIDKFTKLGINTPQAYAEYIAKNPKEVLPAEDYPSIYKNAGLTEEEINIYDPGRNEYFTPEEVQGTLEGVKGRVTDTAFGGRNLFAGLKLGLEEIPSIVETPTNPYSYEPLRGYPNVQIGYTMDKTGGVRTPSVFRNAAGQEVPIDPKKGLTVESYPELTKDMQYTQPKKPLSQMRFKYGGEVTKKEKKYDDTTIEFGLLHPNAVTANTQKLSYNIPGEGLGKFIRGATFITPMLDIISDIKAEKTLKGDELIKYKKLKKQELNRIKNPDLQKLQDITNSQTNSGYLKYGGTLQKPIKPEENIATEKEKNDIRNKYLENFNTLDTFLWSNYVKKNEIDKDTKNWIINAENEIIDDIPNTFSGKDDIWGDSNLNEIKYLNNLYNRVKPYINKEFIDKMSKGNNNPVNIYKKLKILQEAPVYKNDVDSLQKYLPNVTEKYNLEMVRPFLRKRKYGGTLNYGGQLHEGPDGGVPVDEMGNPNQINPVALVEKGEVSYNTPDGGTYIYSDTLKMDKNNTFAKTAKKIQSRYKFRMKNGVINDPFAKKSYDNEMLGLMDNQEELRDFQNMQSLQKKKYGGDLPTYATGGFAPDDNTKGTYDWTLAQNPAGFMVKPIDNTAAMDKFVNQVEMDYPSRIQPNFNLNTSPVLPKASQVKSDIINTQGVPATKPELYQGMNWAETGLAAAAPVLGGITGMILEGTDKTRPRELNLSRVTPQQISLERRRRAAREGAAVATSNLSRALKGASPTAGSYMSNVVAGITDIDRNLSNQLGESYTQEELQNAQYRQQADMTNADIAMQEAMYNTEVSNQFDAGRKARMNAYLSQIGQGVTSALNQKFQSERDADYLNMLNPNYELAVTGKGLSRRKFYRPRT